MRKVIPVSEHSGVREQLENIRQMEASELREEIARKLVLKVFYELPESVFPSKPALLGPDGKPIAKWMNPPLGKPTLVRTEALDAIEGEEGFGEHMLFKRGDYKEVEINGFMDETGCRNRRSFGVFMSLAYSKETPSVNEQTVKRRFFGAFLAPALIDELKKSGKPDELLENFKRNIDFIPEKYHSGFYHVLGKHPKALRAYLRINSLDAEGLQEFYGRFLKNQDSYDGIVKL